MEEFNTLEAMISHHKYNIYQKDHLNSNAFQDDQRDHLNT